LIGDVKDVRAAQLALHALSCHDQRVAAGDVGCDRDRAVAELSGERLDPVSAAGEETEPVSCGCERAGGRLADAG
jgi:hypothetical protein